MESIKIVSCQNVHTVRDVNMVLLFILMKLIIFRMKIYRQNGDVCMNRKMVFWGDL